ncbi:MAG TPA: hypothetical protein PKD26_06210 [Pyrinomonadaceae bacterium]|nr:hypothetical protein [Pyrinomonadaceae bacterium]
MEGNESRNRFGIIDWLPYIGGVLAGLGVSQIALGLFVVRNPDDTLLYISLVLFALAIICWLISFVLKKRRAQF